MTDEHQTAMILEGRALYDYFFEALNKAAESQKTKINDHSQSYLVNLLVDFIKAENLFNTTDSEIMEETLADLLARAVEAPLGSRFSLFKRLGDYSLYMGGFFSESLNRKLVDLDYYIAMGGSAYSRLAEFCKGKRDGDVFYELFHELATKFVICVDLLGEISDSSRLATDTGVLRLYEKWLRTKSSRNAKQLADHGIIPDPSLDTRFLQ